MLWLLLLLVCDAQAGKSTRGAADLLDTEHWLNQNCQDYKAEHQWLVDYWMAPYTFTSPLNWTAQSILDFPDHAQRWGPLGDGSPALPVLFHFDGEVHLHPGLRKLRKIPDSADIAYTIGNPGWHFLPTLRELAQEVKLPRFVIAMDFEDGPNLGHRMAPFPYIAQCNFLQREKTLVFPFKFNSTTHLGNINKPRAGPGDKRDRRAVFVGSDSGMLEGQRRALVRLSRSRPKEIYARFVEGGLQPYEHGLQDYKDMVVPKLNMSDQIDMFQKVVYAGGNCASIRLDQLLNSDSLVLLVEDSAFMWYMPLLVPWTHYVPLTYKPQITELKHQEGFNFWHRFTWAEKHPEQVARIVRESTSFAQRHLNRKGKMCYLTRLLLAYAARQTDRETAAKLYWDSLAQFPGLQH